MDTSSSLEGVDAFFAALEKIERAADEAVREVVATASTLLVSEAQANFVGSHARGEPHVGGDKPNIVSGDLRRSIRADPITQYGKADYGTTVGPRMIYGRRVELGFNGSPGYPYFGPAVEKVRPEFERMAADIWQSKIGT
ncbi:MAG: hypothetical protein AB7T06_24740 [Kofleriaceae bacterium]